MAMPTKAQIFKHWMEWLDKRGFDWGSLVVGHVNDILMLNMI